MVKFTKKQIEALVNTGAANRLHECNYSSVINQEGYLSRIAYSAGAYGTTALIFKGEKSGQLYAAFGSAVYIYG